MLVESSNRQLWDYCEEKQCLFRLYDGWLIPNVLPEQLKEVFLNSHNVCFSKNNVPHRENGPAVIHINGDEEWYIDGYRHREDGPASKRIYSNGEVHNYYYLNGRVYDKYWWFQEVQLIKGK